MRGWRMALVLILAGGAPLGAQEPIAGGELPPPGYGSMRQDHLVVQFSAGDLEVRFLPLDERVLRLLAPDAYESLHGLVAARQAALDSVARAAGVSSPGLALVTFFANRPDARFDPTNVALLYRNQFYRPAAILPYTGNFTGRQLGVRQQASAIYLFDTPLPVYERFDVVYGTTQSNIWEEVLRRIERERARVLSRWQADRKDSTRTGRPE